MRETYALSEEADYIALLLSSKMNHSDVCPLLGIVKKDRTFSGSYMITESFGFRNYCLRFKGIIKSSEIGTIIEVKYLADTALQIGSYLSPFVFCIGLAVLLYAPQSFYPYFLIVSTLVTFFVTKYYSQRQLNELRTQFETALNIC